MLQKGFGDLHVKVLAPFEGSFLAWLGRGRCNRVPGPVNGCSLECYSLEKPGSDSYVGRLPSLQQLTQLVLSAGNQPNRGCSLSLAVGGGASVPTALPISSPSVCWKLSHISKPGFKTCSRIKQCSIFQWVQFLCCSSPRAVGLPVPRFRLVDLIGSAPTDPGSPFED